jgi:hypothetical protein
MALRAARLHKPETEFQPLPIQAPNAMGGRWVQPAPEAEPLARRAGAEH